VQQHQGNSRGLPLLLLLQSLLLELRLTTANMYVEMVTLKWVMGWRRQRQAQRSTAAEAAARQAVPQGAVRAGLNVMWVTLTDHPSV
jgi:hypothetical protein